MVEKLWAQVAYCSGVKDLYCQRGRVNLDRQLTAIALVSNFLDSISGLMTLALINIINVGYLIGFWCGYLVWYLFI